VPDASLLCSPTADFVSYRINASIARRSLFPDRDRMLATTFRSPATVSVLTDPIPGSTFLACRFASYQPLPLPVRPFAPPPTFPVCSGIGSLIAVARCRFHDSHGPLPARLPLPFRTFTSLWIKAFRRTSCKLVHLPNPPGSRSLPAAACYY
jgi:hypothetical protein